MTVPCLTSPALRPALLWSFLCVLVVLLLRLCSIAWELESDDILRFSFFCSPCVCWGLQNLGLIDTSKVSRPLPWRPATNVKREGEDVRPIHWYCDAPLSATMNTNESARGSNVER